MDQLRAMRTLVAISDAGSLSAAARQLGQPLTTVSRQLAALEGQLGASLIARSTRRMALTDEGRSYVETCRRIFDDLDGAESRIAGREGDPAGEIAITAPVVFGRLHIVPVLARFLERYPRLDARLQLIDRVVDLTEEGIDVAVRIGELPDSALIAIRVGSIRLVTCASPAYLKKHGEPKTPKDLAEHDTIAFSNLVGGNRWSYTSRVRGRSSVRLKSRLAINSADAAVDAAVAGLGVTRVLSYQAEAALRSKRLRAILEPYEDTPVPVSLVRRAVRHPKPQLRLFVEFASRELRTRLGRQNANR